MTQNELIGKIRELRQIKPRKDWVLLTKSQILGQEETPKFELFPFFKPAYAGLFFLLLLAGLIEFSQGALPGDPLYSLKRITEKAQAVFVSKEEQPKLQLELTSKRLEELNKVADANRVKRLAPALNEFQKTKIVAKKEILDSIKNKSEKEAIKVVKEVAPELNKINEKQNKVYLDLGIGESREESDQTTEKAVVEILINDAKNSTLTEEQKTDLAKVEEYYKSGDFQEAFQLFMTGSLNPSY